MRASYPEGPANLCCDMFSPLQSASFSLFCTPPRPVIFFKLLSPWQKGKAVTSTPETNTLSVADLLTSSSITTTKLYEKNYLQWSAAVKTFLTTNKKMKFIEEPMPEAATLDWTKEDAQVRT